VDSREKVQHLREWLRELRPEDEATAQQLQILVALAPALMKALPEDPAELDRYLRTAAWAAVRCRSDEAPAIGLFELEAGEWRPVEVEG
jgi:hypothetical protein